MSEANKVEKPYYSHSLIAKAIIKRKVQGLRSPKNRSLHLVNEDLRASITQKFTFRIALVPAGKNIFCIHIRLFFAM